MELLVRTDAGPEIGTGHVMRMIALVQAWERRGGDGRFLSAKLPKSLAAKVRTMTDAEIEFVDAEPGSRSDAEATRQRIEENADAAALDGYHFDAAFQEEVAATEATILCIDDVVHADRYPVDIVLNQNLHASPDDYPDGPRLLLGPRYALLRREFLERRAWDRHVPEGRPRVLVTLGGTAPGTALSTVRTALSRLGRDVDLTVVAGPLARDGDLPGEDRGGADVRVLRDVEDMTGPMTRADVCIAAAGTTSWELLATGTPIVAIVLAENQRRIAASLEEAGVGVNLGWHEDLQGDELAEAVDDLLGDPTRRRRMARRGQLHVDASGADRVAMHLADGRTYLRPARWEDAERLWRWANDPETRRQSFSSQRIAWSEHVGWFGSRIEDPRSHLYVLCDREEAPVGHVRFEGPAEQPEISVVVDPDRRGEGFGTDAIRLGSVRTLAGTEADEIRAFIKTGNEASVQAFEKAGFHREGGTTKNGQDALLYVREGDGD